MGPWRYLPLIITMMAAIPVTWGGQFLTVEDMRHHGIKVSQETAMKYARGEIGAVQLVGPNGTVYDYTVRIGDTRESAAMNMCRQMQLEVGSAGCARVKTLFWFSLPSYMPQLPDATIEDWVFKRTALIKMLRDMYPGRYRRYLEIGCGKAQDNFLRVGGHFDTAVCVDPGEGGTYVMTSDEFFAQNTQEWDVIFVDGLHLEEQVLKDVDNALRWLAPGGTVVLHDCLPRDRNTASRVNSNSALGMWNGDVWKAALRLRAFPGLEVAVVDIDQGCGLVRKAGRGPPVAQRLVSDRLTGYGELDYDADFDGKQRELLNVVTVQGAREWLRETEERRRTDTDHARATLSLVEARRVTPQPAADDPPTPPPPDSASTSSVEQGEEEGIGELEEGGEGPLPSPSTPSAAAALSPWPASNSSSQPSSLSNTSSSSSSSSSPPTPEEVVPVLELRVRNTITSPTFSLFSRFRAQCFFWDNDKHCAWLPAPRQHYDQYQAELSFVTGIREDYDGHNWEITLSTWLWDPRGNVTCCPSALVIRAADLVSAGPEWTPFGAAAPAV